MRNFQAIEDSEGRESVGRQFVLRTASTCQLLVKAQVDYIETGYQGANLQLSRKSTQLPKCLLMLKGPVKIFLGGPTAFHTALPPVLQRDGGKGWQVLIL